MKRVLRVGRGGERGAEIIELAVVLPILLLIFAGLIDFGFLFQRFETVTNAAREGARVAVLPNYTQADVQTRVQQYLTAAGLTGAPAAVVAYTNMSVPPSGMTIQVATVTVTYPSTFLYLGPIAAMVGGSGYGTITLRAVSQMRLEGTAAGGS